ncbi:MAG: helix-turn-helix domain-containing protein [Verrucomicrobiota bacterium]
MKKEMTSIGAQLRKAREEKNWTVKEAARRTKLKVDAIEKMEADEFELFPSISYARGFVRIYARELGLNGWELMRSFEDAPDVPVDGLDLHPDDLEAIPRRTQPPLATSQSIGLFVFGLVIVMALVLVGIKIYQIWPSGEATGEIQTLQTGPGSTGPATAEPLAPAAVPSDSPLAPSPQSPAPAVAAPAAPLAAPAAPSAQPVDGTTVTAVPAHPAAAVPAQINRLRLRAPVNAPDKDRWVRVTGIDENGSESILYEALIPAGATLPDPLSPAWTATKFRVKFREAAAIQIIMNGTNFGTYDGRGVQTVELPAR